MDYKDYFDKFIEPYEHKCPWCNNTRKWLGNRYIITCGVKECRKKQREQTCLQKYGRINNSGTPDWLDKTKATNNKKFGADWKMETDEGKNNYKNVMRNKFGVDNYFQTEQFKNGYKAKMLIKYGKETNLHTEEFKQMMLAKWGASNPGQSLDIAKKKKKKILFNDIWFDSKAEVEVYKFCIKHSFDVEYHPCNIKYSDSNGIEHIFQPDFSINGKLFEVKGDHLWQNDKLYFPYRNKMDKESLMKKDIRDLAKTECIKSNDVTIILASLTKNEDELLNLIKGVINETLYKALS